MHVIREGNQLVGRGEQKTGQVPESGTVHDMVGFTYTVKNNSNVCT